MVQRQCFSNKRKIKQYLLSAFGNLGNYLRNSLLELTCLCEFTHKILSKFLLFIYFYITFLTKSSGLVWQNCGFLILVTCMSFVPFYWCSVSFCYKGWALRVKHRAMCVSFVGFSLILSIPSFWESEMWAELIWMSLIQCLSQGCNHSDSQGYGVL